MPWLKAIQTNEMLSIENKFPCKSIRTNSVAFSSNLYYFNDIHSSGEIQTQYMLKCTWACIFPALEQKRCSFHSPFLWSFILINSDQMAAIICCQPRECCVLLVCAVFMFVFHSVNKLLLFEMTFNVTIYALRHKTILCSP